MEKSGCLRSVQSVVVFLSCQNEYGLLNELGPMFRGPNFDPNELTTAMRPTDVLGLAIEENHQSTLQEFDQHVSFGGFHQWGDPNSWMVYFMEHPKQKWMIWR